MLVGKTADELMHILKEKHGIEISDKKHYSELQKMGYFHGFKGYRFIKKPENKIPYTHFDEVLAVYQFDTKLKALFYPHIMFIETALKNVTLDTIIATGSANFEHVYEHLLNDYAKHESGTADYKRKMKNRLQLRTRIYSTISYNYNSDKEIVQHYLHDNRPVPLWVIFEMMTLGDFGFFVHCLNSETRTLLMENLQMKRDIPRNNRVLEDIIHTLRGARNAVAHNTAMFDNRHHNGNTRNRLIQFLQTEMNMKNMTFETIIDDVILMSFLLKTLKVDKREIADFIQTFFRHIDQLEKAIPTTISSLIIDDTLKKKRLTLHELIK